LLLLGEAVFFFIVLALEVAAFLDVALTPAFLHFFVPVGGLGFGGAGLGGVGAVAG
jgi:hypothetical protein